MFCMYRFWRNNATVFSGGSGYDHNLAVNVPAQNAISLTDPWAGIVMSGVMGGLSGLRGYLQAIAVKVAKNAFLQYLIRECEKLHEFFGAPQSTGGENAKQLVYRLVV